MKQILPLLFLLACGIQAIRATAVVEGYQLSGIVNLPESKLAVFSFNQGFSHRDMLLQEGQREIDLEILKIQPTPAVVNTVLHGTNRVTFRLEAPQAGSINASTIQFTNVNLPAFLDVYEMIAQRSLLRSPKLPPSTFNMRLDSTNRAELLPLMEQKLSEQRIKVIPDGEKFALVLTEAEAKTFKPGAPPVTTSGDKIFPAESIVWIAAPTFSCAMICAELMGKKLDRESFNTVNQRGEIRFRQVTPLTRAECIYAIETNLRFHGIKLVPGDNGLLKVVPFDEGKNGFGPGQK